VFFATDVQDHDPRDSRSGIVNGYLWAPGDSGVVAEHGSMYAKDLVLGGGGRVHGFGPHSGVMLDDVMFSNETDRGRMMSWLKARSGQR
jgi:hypothetical protein